MPRNTVLVADDEVFVRSIVSKMLDDDYLVLEAADGEEALNMARLHQPDLILMDIMMPKMDGYIACSKIKADQATKHIPIIMLTAVSQELNKKLAQKMGAGGYVTKPFTQQQLLDVARQFVKSAT